MLVTSYLRNLNAKFEGLTNEGEEAQLARPLQDLIEGLAPTCGRSDVHLREQAHMGELGIPDFSVKVGRLAIGHIETKPPGKGADVSRYRTAHDRAQAERFARLPNVLYTDGWEFAIYRSGDRLGDMASFDREPSNTEQVAATAQVADLVSLLTEFLSWQAVAPKSLTELAASLAPLCAVLRDAVYARLDDGSSEVALAAKEFESSLFPGREQHEIADAFAQVCAYSMLLARDSGAEDLSSAHVKNALSGGHPLLGWVVRVLLDDRTEEELGWAIDSVRALIEAVDFDRLRRSSHTRQDQTWLYFYETFLAAYDPKLRDEFGVYYTPREVISAQVSLVDDLLRRRLGKRLGLADPGVTVLDPATGTGSYPLRVLEQISDTARDEIGEAAVPEIVSGAAGRLHAFEVLVGPYAVAHLRIAEQIAALGASVPGEELGVYMTDTLDSPYREPGRTTRILQPLVDEQLRALKVKGSETAVTVCLGNPPYERGRRDEGEEKEPGGWVVHGEGSESPIFEAFTEPVRAAGKGGHLKNLYNEYVYFWRWALWKVFEQEHGGGGSPGIVSFITASSYLTGPGFGGMREWMRRVCDEIWILDLGGEGRGARKDENVFAIQTPVAIAICLRTSEGKPESPARVNYFRVEGSRKDKSDFLDAVETVDAVEWDVCTDGWQDIFKAAHSEEWADLPAVTALFPWQHSGTQVKRTWPISPDPETLKTRWLTLLGSADRARLLKETRDRKVVSRPKPLIGQEQQLGIADESKDATPAPIRRYAYRPWDRHWILADSRVIDYPRPDLWRSQSDRQIFMVCFLTEQLGDGPAAIVSSAIPDLHAFRGSYGGKHVIPLYRDSLGTPNIAAGVLNILSEEFSREVTTEDVFAYAYSVLSSPRYVERFRDELAVPGPRLPITFDPALFDEACELGKELIWVHTFGERMTSDSRPRGDVPAGSARVLSAVSSDPLKMPDDFEYLEADQAIRIGEDGLVGPVSPEVWDYSVSGWKVVERWLSYRMRDGAGRARGNPSPLDEIRPTRWLSEFTIELLEVLASLEATVARFANQEALVDRVVDGPSQPADLFSGTEEIQPSSQPSREPDGQGQLML